MEHIKITFEQTVQILPVPWIAAHKPAPYSNILTRQATSKCIIISQTSIWSQVLAIVCFILLLNSFFLSLYLSHIHRPHIITSFQTLNKTQNSTCLYFSGPIIIYPTQEFGKDFLWTLKSAYLHAIYIIV